MENINPVNEQNASVKEMKTKGLSLGENPSVGKMIFFLGIALAMSAYGPFMLFAPAPIAMSMLIFGNGRTLIGMGLILLVLAAAGIYWPVTMTTSALFVVAGIYAYFLFRLIKGNIHPVRGLIATGVIILVSGVLIYAAFAWFTKFSLEKHVLEMVTTAIQQIQASTEYASVLSQADEDVLEFKSLLQNPKAMTDQIMSWIPAVTVVSIFLNLWASFYMLLRNSVLWRRNVSYVYGLRDLLYFKTPDLLIFPLIIGLLLAVTGDYFWGERAQVWGYNVLYSLGILYFFQGLGVFLDLLNFVRIMGIFKTLVVISMLMLAWRVLMVIGIFDTWFNFRKYFIRKKNEGDES